MSRAMNLSGSVYNKQTKYFLFTVDHFVLTNIVDPDEMLLYAAFHPGLDRLQKYALRSHQYIQIYTYCEIK